MTRQHGAVESARGHTPFGHLGWPYRSRTEFLSRAAEYIADGVALNQWIQYVGAGNREELRAELDAMPTDTSTVTVTPATEFYGVDDLDDVVDPDVALELRAATVEDATAQGYSGVRIVADPTAVNSRPEQRETFARLEFLIDQTMVDAPITALCAYDAVALGEGAGELVCLHPLVGPGSPTFRVYAEPGAAFAIGGEIDAAGADTFATTLQRILPVAADSERHPELVVDAHGLEFIGHRELLDLDRAAQRHGRPVLLRGCGPLLRRLAGLLDLTNLHLQTA